MAKLVALILLSVVCASAFALSVQDQWKDFKLTHRKFYSKVEEPARLKIFQNNLLLAQRLQAGNPQAKYGVTQFSDLTPQEFKAIHLGLKPKASSNDERNAYKPTLKDIPAAWDWVQKGAVTKVKNQGSCGSCWAFSTIQNIEGQNFLKHNELVVLSEQQLVDCDKVDEGCNGGLMQEAMQWLAEHGGVATEADYPYLGYDDTCKYTPSMMKVNVTGYRNVSTDETEIAASLVELGPLSIGVVADPWQFYIAGIANPWFCGGDLDHGVLLVGYGHGKGLISSADFWLVKNSWGSSWGESGYIRLERGKGVCGMNQDVSTSTIA